jgi:hypothetical protein
MFTTKKVTWTILGIAFLLYLVGIYWSFEPEPIDIHSEVTQAAKVDNVAPVVGYTTTTALIKVSEVLLYKPGGYLSNDIMLPSLLLDNMPAWEFGALEMIRDMALVMRKDLVVRNHSHQLVSTYKKHNLNLILIAKALHCQVPNQNTLMPSNIYTLIALPW